MSLDQDLATALDTTGVFVGAARRRAELRADLLAVGATAFATRPALLRRAAALLAAELPAAVDRLVTGGDTDAVALTTALALHTGLPVTITGADGARGEVHHGDRVAVVTPRADPAATLAGRVRAAGAEPVATLSVFAADGTPAFA
ncbi:hypothetical protein [Amycolatopsis sp. FDAARGOS 1241]|uniref:hypothetical protein n=1 Tax=Amycolatopsis sp. FDAARGOS 1241 TaxID=2778070 RepID=UPI00195209A8|nr:hypothetical protein [Amycolatopsis sp. FDAARGOS 1241]QRP43285.1 hypothetical protein I6J71_28160 [Amycolatopsis sp. FDAARGOS 1241]